MAETAGPFGEPVFPDAAVDVELDGFRQYRTTAAFEDVAKFYEKAFAGSRWIFGQRAEERGVPSASFAPGVRDTVSGWGALVVTPIPPKGRRPSAGTHIIVTRRA